MGKIIISLNVSLDGVAQDPDGKEGFTHGSWFTESGGADLAEWSSVGCAEALGAEAVLLGRRSDEWFASRWASRTGEWADRLNSMPKYVVSATASEAGWNNSTILGGDVPSEVAKLKQRLDGEIVLYGSLTLAHTLLEHGLVDELRLTVFPVVLGTGERLFTETTGRAPLRLMSTRPIGDGLVLLTYAVVR